MPVPSTIADLSTTAGSNSPAGTEAPSTLDNYQRAHASFIAQLRAVIGGATDANIPTSWPTESDLSGAVISQEGNSGTTAGTSTAYTLTPSTALAAYTANSTFWVTFHAASGASPTLQISGLGTPPALVKQLFDGTYAAIAAGDIPINHRSRVTLISTTQALVESLPTHSDTLNTTRMDIASAATVNLTTGAPNTRHINITGTTGITAFTVVAGQCYFLRFNAALTLTNSASIVTQSGANITTAGGDTCILRATSANVVEIIAYTPFKNQAAGYAQTWQDVLSSRLHNTAYQNTTGKPIMWAFSGSGASVEGGVPMMQVSDDGVTWVTAISRSDAAINQAAVIVPNGWYYKAVNSASMSYWAELR